MLMQMEKKMKEGISGEDLNVLIGSIPYKADTTEKVKLNILNILSQKYDVNQIISLYLLSLYIILIKRWGCSSPGRASALQAEGSEFDPRQLHQL